MATTIYTCLQGESLASVAQKAYGSVDRIYDIVKANKGLSVSAYLPAGLQINVPILDNTGGTVAKQLLPPWAGGETVQPSQAGTAQSLTATQKNDLVLSIEALYRRIYAIELLAYSAISSISAIRQELAEIQQDIDGILGRLDTAEGNITALQNDVVSLDSRLDTVEGDISTLQGQVATNTANIATNTANIATNTSNISTIQSTLTGYAASFTTLQYLSTVQTLTNSASSIAWNMALGHHARITLSASGTLENPTNVPASTNAIFPSLEVIQDGTGGRVLSFGSSYKFPDSYTAPSTAANSRVIYNFYLRSDGNIGVVSTYYAT